MSSDNLPTARSHFGLREADYLESTHREGGQSQFIERSLPPPSGARLSVLLDTIKGRLGEQWTVERMAMEAHVSVRSIQRHVRAATGMAPGEWLQSERVAHARDLLEETTLSIEEIAVHTGFGTSTNFRQHFRTAVGLPPASYRSRFRTIGSEEILSRKSPNL